MDEENKTTAPNEQAEGKEEIKSEVPAQPVVTTNTTPEKQPEVTPKKEETNTGMAIIAYILFFVPLLTEAKNDPFVKFHVKQGLVIFSLCVITWIIHAILPWRIAWSFYWLFNLAGLGIFILAIIGIINASGGKQEKLPLVGHFGDFFKI